jgi:uncharacterized OB-fold protein
MTSGTDRYPLDAPTPDPDGAHPNAPFWRHLRQHELRVQVCASCGRSRTPATDICPHCQSIESTWQLVEPAGRIHSWSRVWHAALPSLADRVPYVIAWVEIDDHPDRPRFLGNVLGDPEAPLAMGDRVVGVFQDRPDGTRLNWARAGGVPEDAAGPS